MKYLADTIRLNWPRRRGSVLVMAIVIITLLFIVGSTFLLTSRTTKQTVAAIDATSSLDDGIDAVINRINTVLVDDLFGSDAVMLNGSGSDEYWDYPYTNAGSFGTNDDMWLASMVPQVMNVSGTNYYFWNHVTDLYGNSFGLPTGFYYSPASRLNSDSWQWDGTFPNTYPYWIDRSNRHNFARVIYDNQSTEVIVSAGDWDVPADTWPWGAQADADGDGISDSYWVKIPEITGPNGKNLYAAVRIIDNCGMINVNTAYLNNTYITDTIPDTIGANLTDVSLDVMCPPGLFLPVDKPAERREIVNYIHKYRAKVDMPSPATDPYTPVILADLNDHGTIYYYDHSVLPFLDHRRLATVVPMGNPGDNFPLPFDLSDEMELRNRFCLNSLTQTALDKQWASYLTNGYRRIPFSSPGEEEQWYVNLFWDPAFWETTPRPASPASNLDRRHMLTAYSWDRTMRGYSTSTTAPVDGFAPPRTAAPPPIPVTLENLQANINTATAAQIATALIYAYESANFGDIVGTTPDYRDTVAQLACNIVDYRDGDNIVSYLHYYAGPVVPGVADTYVFGYDAHPLIDNVSVTMNANPIATPGVFGVTFTNPYPVDIDSSGFRLRFCDSGGLQLPGTQDIALPATTLTRESLTSILSSVGDPNVFTAVVPATTPPTYRTDLGIIALIQTVMDVSNGTSHDILIDKLTTTFPAIMSNGDTSTATQLAGYANPITNRNSDIRNENFNTVGEVPKVFAAIGPPEIDPGVGVGALDPIQAQIANLAVGVIEDGRLNIEDEIDQNLLSRLTVLSRIGIPVGGAVADDNNGDGTIDDREELAIPGRININTAPQKVLEALPWVVDSALSDLPLTNPEREKLARAIIAYRDKMELVPGSIDYRNRAAAIGTNIATVNPGPGFKYPAELINVTQTSADNNYDIRRQSKDAAPLAGMPDTSSADGAGNDLEERDVIFHRMSNLVTVRSDTFTAYIMVRVGEVGPQKRVIAIFDRSGVFEQGDVPRLVALHPVPDPR